MYNWISKLIFIILASSVLAELSIANTGSSRDSSNSWKFTVLLDDTPIGYHSVDISTEENRKTVHTQASFDVRILFIPVYSYEHETRELWQDGCLVDINSMTDDNGDDYFISSVQSPQQLTLETRDGKSSLEGCVRTFAYWDIDLLKSERLLNTQTGEYQEVTVTDMGMGVLSYEDKQIEARHFRLVCKDMSIDLWYTKEMQWLALESVTESGAVLRYLPEAMSGYTMGAKS